MKLKFPNSGGLQGLRAGSGRALAMLAVNIQCQCAMAQSRYQDFEDTGMPAGNSGDSGLGWLALIVIALMVFGYWIVRNSKYGDLAGGGAIVLLALYGFLGNKGSGPVALIIGMLIVAGMLWED